MKRLVIAAAVAAAATMAGAAFADTIENSYGNTIVVTNESGGVARYHFDADNTFSVTLPDGNTAGGTYEVTSDQICLTMEGGEPACTEYDGSKNVGDTWTQAGSDGSTITVSIEAGR